MDVDDVGRCDDDGDRCFDHDDSGCFYWFGEYAGASSDGCGEKNGCGAFVGSKELDGYDN